MTHSWRNAGEYDSMNDVGVDGTTRRAVSVTVVPSSLSCALHV